MHPGSFAFGGADCVCYGTTHRARRAFFDKCTRICPMQKSWSDIRESITTPLMGFAIVVLFFVCLLLAMVVLVSIARVLMG